MAAFAAARVTARGGAVRARIISFCLFGDKTIYGEGAVQNAHLAKALFPGWACVFYVGDGASDVTVERCKPPVPSRRCTGMLRPAAPDAPVPAGM